MLPGMGALLGLGAGAPTAGGGIPGFSGSSSATSSATGAPVSFGGFTFQPKGGDLGGLALIALGVGVGLVVWGLRKR